MEKKAGQFRKNLFLLFFLSLAGLFLLAFGAEAFEDGIQGKRVVLGALDKGTTRVEKLSVLVGSTVRFGRLDITLRGCEFTPATRPPDSAVFMEIDEEDFEQNKTRVFSGWMFASSPTVNALDHPLYDIWVLACREN